VRSRSPARRASAALAATLLAASLISALNAFSAHSGSALAQAGNDIDCTLDSTGKTPIIDLGDDTYLGAQGGLYPRGSNEIPAPHQALGTMRAAEITPRDDSGNPDPDGKIAFVAIGVSNTRREFTAFLEAAGPEVADSIVLVNAAQNGEPVSSWLDPNDDVWSLFDRALLDAGVTAEQVQGAWVKIPERYEEPPADFPANIFDYRGMLTAALRTIQQKIPNLQVAYLSSRIYGGYNAVTSSNPEPNAYEEGFGVKWVIEQQIAGNPVLNADPGRGEVVAPWIAWGPYIWADGTTPRSDGLTWECGDLNSDGIHPNGNGSEKVADLLLDFLRDEPTATWLFGEPVTAAEAPEPATVTTTTLAGDPGLSEATLPVPDTTGRPGSDNQGETSGTGSPGDQGSLTGDTTRRERREQQRAEREQERQEQGSGQQAPGATGAPDDDDPDSVAAGPADIEDVPPLVWALAAAGAMMLLFLVMRFIRDKTRPKEEDPPAA
jgi:hypothetical protein